MQPNGFGATGAGHWSVNHSPQLVSDGWGGHHDALLEEAALIDGAIWFTI